MLTDFCRERRQWSDRPRLLRATGFQACGVTRAASGRALPAFSFEPFLERVPARIDAALGPRFAVGVDGNLNRIAFPHVEPQEPVAFAKRDRRDQANAIEDRPANSEVSRRASCFVSNRGAMVGRCFTAGPIAIGSRNCSEKRRARALPQPVEQIARQSVLWVASYSPPGV
jgi:hypothetical protein